MVKAMTVKVSPRALVARINRALKKEGQQLRAARGARAVLDVGDYFIVDVSRQAVLLSDVDLEEYAKKNGFLKKYESVGA